MMFQFIKNNFELINLRFLKCLIFKLYSYNLKNDDPQFQIENAHFPRILSNFVILSETLDYKLWKRIVNNARIIKFSQLFTDHLLLLIIAYYIIFLSFDNPQTPEGVDDTTSNPMPSPMESIMAMFLMSMTNFGDYYGAFERTEHEMEAKV